MTRKPFLLYFFELIFRIADVLHLPTLLLWFNQGIKPNTRPLTEREVALARSIFGDSICYDHVRVDDRARVACQSWNLAYVGFYCINSWGPLSDAHFIHEMVHIWQYERVGSVYIPRALYAQRTPAGYNYGGPSALAAALEQGQGLRDFNYEQQGDIVADYFRLRNGQSPLYCPPDPRYLPLLERIVREGLTRKL